MDAITLVSALGVLAAFNESLLEYVLGRWHIPRVDRALPFVSLLLGIVEALAFKLNALPAEWDAPVLVGQIATGVALGMGSNVVHLVMGKVVK